MVVDVQLDAWAGYEPPFADVVGLWDDSHLFTKYQVTAKFTGKVMGGVPQDPNVIEGWMQQRFIGGDEQFRALLAEELQDRGIENPDRLSMDELREATKSLAAEQKGNAFRRDENGLYISDYQLKAAFKECVNILYAGERWGRTSKGPRSFVAERIFIDEARIYLGRQEPDGRHMQVGHVTGPKGPHSTLTYYDYAVQPEITFTVSSLRDCLESDHWRDIFLTMQREGIGAIRSLGYGQFRVTNFKRI